MEWPAYLGGALYVLDVNVLPALLDLLDALPALLNFVALLELLEGGRVAARGVARLMELLPRSRPCHLGRSGWAPPAGRGGWRCARHRHREGGHGAAYRTAGAR